MSRQRWEPASAEEGRTGLLGITLRSAEVFLIVPLTWFLQQVGVTFLWQTTMGSSLMDQVSSPRQETLNTREWFSGSRPLTLLLRNFRQMEQPRLEPTVFLSWTTRGISSTFR